MFALHHAVAVLPLQVDYKHDSPVGTPHVNQQSVSLIVRRFSCKWRGGIRRSVVLQGIALKAILWHVISASTGWHRSPNPCRGWWTSDVGSVPRTVGRDERDRPNPADARGDWRTKASKEMSIEKRAPSIPSRYASLSISLVCTSLLSSSTTPKAWQSELIWSTRVVSQRETREHAYSSLLRVSLHRQTPLVQCIRPADDRLTVFFSELHFVRFRWLSRTGCSLDGVAGVQLDVAGNRWPLRQ